MANTVSISSCNVFRMYTNNFNTITKASTRTRMTRNGQWSRNCVSQVSRKIPNDTNKSYKDWKNDQNDKVAVGGCTSGWYGATSVCVNEATSWEKKCILEKNKHENLFLNAWRNKTVERLYKRNKCRL